MNMKAKKGQTKLLAAVAVFAMVFCVFAVAMPVVDAATSVDSGVTYAEATDVDQADISSKLNSGVITLSQNETWKLTSNVVITEGSIDLNGKILKITQDPSTNYTFQITNSDGNADAQSTMVNAVSGGTLTVDGVDVVLIDNCAGISHTIYFFTKTDVYVLNGGSLTAEKNGTGVAKTIMMTGDALDATKRTTVYVDGTDSKLIFKNIAGQAGTQAFVLKATNGATVDSTGMVGTTTMSVYADLNNATIRGDAVGLYAANLVKSNIYAEDLGIYTGSATDASDLTTLKLGNVNIDKDSNVDATNIYNDLSDAANTASIGTKTITFKGEGKASGIFTDVRSNSDSAQGVTLNGIDVQDFGMSGKIAITMTEAKIKDGTPYTVKSGDKVINYALFNQTVGLNDGTSKNILYGVAIVDPEYTGNVIGLKELSPQVISLTQNATAVLNASQTSFVGDDIVKDVRDEEYKVEVCVELTYVDISKNLNGFTYAYQTIGFKVLPATTELKVEKPEGAVWGWDVKNDEKGTIEYTFTYTIGGKTYTAVDPSVFNVSAILKDTSGNTYAQSEWVGITFVGDRKEFTLIVTATPVDSKNYKSDDFDCDSIGKVVITNTTNLTSKLEITPVVNENLLGLNTNFMQKDVKFTCTTEGATSTTTAFAYTIAGTFFAVNDYIGFDGSNKALQSGYYLAFKIDAGLTSWAGSEVTVKVGDAIVATEYDESSIAFDGYFIIRVADLVDSSATPNFKDIVLTFDRDGSASNIYAKTTYTFTHSDTKAGEFKYTVLFKDNAPAVDIIRTAALNGMVIIPNGWDASQEFMGWESEIKKENGDKIYLAGGSILTVGPAYDGDGDGIITLVAKYDAGTTPSEPTIPGYTDYADSYTLYLSLVDDEVGFVLMGNGIIKAGTTVTVTFSFFYIDDDGDSPIGNATVDFVVEEDIVSGIGVNNNITIPAEVPADAIMNGVEASCGAVESGYMSF